MSKLFEHFGWFGSPNSAYSKYYLSSMCLSHFVQSLMHMLHMWHIYALTNVHTKYWAYMLNLVGIFVSGTYLSVTGRVEVAGGVVWDYKCKNVGSLCPFSMLAMWAVFAIWQPYLFSNICQICAQSSLLNGWCQWSHMCHIFFHTLPICPCKIFGIYGKYAQYVSISLSGTYLAITGEVKAAGGSFWPTYAIMLGPQACVACWLCELYLECGSHILFSDKCEICKQDFLLLEWCQWLQMWHIYAYTTNIYISNSWHIWHNAQ